MLLHGQILQSEEVVSVDVADPFALKRVHDGHYLSKIYYGQFDAKEKIRLGLPVTSKLFHRSATEVEATRQTCYAALEEGIAVCLAGGKHHARKDAGEGFCVFNDVAIAIRDLQVHRPGIKVMVVDTDAHQGGGTNSLLSGDPNIFTYSIHSGRGLGSGLVKGSMDVETVRYVEGPMYLKQLFVTLAAALDQFKPDLVIWVAGADNHRRDKIGGMLLTQPDLDRRDEVLLSAFLKNRVPVAVLFGGGFVAKDDLSAKIHVRTVTTAKKLANQYLGI